MLESSNYFLHPTAIIDEGAKIGDGSKIWHWTHICSEATIGVNCSLGQNVFIANGVSLGANVKIQNNVSVYEGVTLEDDVFCGPSVVFTNVYNPRSTIERKSEYRSTTVRKGATLGANCTVVCGISVGQYAFIGAGALVRENVKDFALVVGNPSKQIAWMSKFGETLDLPLSGNAEVTCTNTGEIYRLQGDQLSCAR